MPENPMPEYATPEHSTSGYPKPPVTDRARWQSEVDALRVREKAHTREGDALAAARRRLPMVPVPAGATVTGEHGPVPLVDVFEGRTQLLAYFHMWHDGAPAAAQCPGCTFFTAQLGDPAHLHSHDVTLAVFCYGPYRQSRRYRDFMGWTMPWYSVRDSAEPLLAGRDFNHFMLVSYLRDGTDVFETYWSTGRGVEAMDNSYALLDRTAYGRQELGEDSPAGWPQHWSIDGSQKRASERPVAQLARLAAGHDDTLDD